MIVGVLGGVTSNHLVMIVNTPVPRPMVTIPVTVCDNPELLCAIAFTWFPLYTNHVVPELTSVPHEYISSRPEVVRGLKIIDAVTPVSIPATVTVLPVKVFTGILVRLAKANDHVVGV